MHNIALNVMHNYCNITMASNTSSSVCQIISQLEEYWYVKKLTLTMIFHTYAMKVLCEEVLKNLEPSYKLTARMSVRKYLSWKVGFVCYFKSALHIQIIHCQFTCC